MRRRHQFWMGTWFAGIMGCGPSAEEIAEAKAQERLDEVRDEFTKDPAKFLMDSGTRPGFALITWQKLIDADCDFEKIPIWTPYEAKILAQMPYVMRGHPISEPMKSFFRADAEWYKPRESKNRSSPSQKELQCSKKLRNLEEQIVSSREPVPEEARFRFLQDPQAFQTWFQWGSSRTSNPYVSPAVQPLVSLYLQTIRVPSVKQANQVLRKAQKGEAFDTLATRIDTESTDDPAALYGLLDSMKELHDLEPEWRAALEDLRIGDTAGPFTTDNGWVVVQIVDRKESGWIWAADGVACRNPEDGTERQCSSYTMRCPDIPEGQRAIHAPCAGFLHETLFFFEPDPISETDSPTETTSAEAVIENP